MSDESRAAEALELSPDQAPAATEIWSASGELAGTYVHYSAAISRMRAAIEAALKDAIPAEVIKQLATRGHHHAAEDVLDSMIAAAVARAVGCSCTQEETEK